MTLFDYLTNFPQKKIQFAEDLCIAESTLYKYIKKEREPKLSIAMRIHGLTNGQVGYNDMLINPQDIDIEEKDEDLL